MKTNYFTMSVVTGLVLALCSCNNEADGPGGTLPDAKPIVMKGEFQAKTENNRSFALDLFKATLLESAGENIFISPYSVNMALNMAWNGTAGDTFKEMSSVLGNDGFTREQINEYAKTLTDALLEVDPSTQLKIANSLWADHTTPFLPSFVQTNQAWYNATVKNVDFTKPETLRTIDQWGLDNTDKKIDGISEGMTSETRAALINAIYFHGKWKHKFDKSDTREETFTNSTGTEAIVRMMNQTANLSCAYDDKGWKMLGLPYGNGAFSMVILMPSSDELLDEKIASLTPDTYYSLFENMSNTSVTVKLPVFKAEYTYKLQEYILPAMGMKQIFDSNAADMSGMCKESMFVDAVVHKTYVEVDEEGTKAAAVTVVSGYNSVGPITPGEFFVDRPFVYSIMENSTGTILFMGRINGF